MTNETVIEELNTLLRGTYMGIRSLEHYIQKVEDEDLKKNFQSMQQEVKLDAQKLAERIQNLGGIPADDEGVSGSMHSFMHKIMLSDDRRKIIEDALEGFAKYGVQYSEELIKGDLDPESKQIAEKVIDTSRRHAEQLKQLLHLKSKTEKTIR
jgi:bacterioferritin